jgi:hypothetical protein
MQTIASRMFVAVLAVAVAVPAAARQPVTEVGPEIYYVEDDSGKLVPVPGFRYADFVELFRLREGLPGALKPPAAVLDAVAVTIDMQAEPAAAATRAARVECTVVQTRGGWVQVPLDLAGLLLTAPPRHEGPGRMILDARPEGRGYRAWFDAAPGAAEGEVRHRVVLDGRVGVDVIGAAETVALRLPEVATSRVELRGARAGVEATVLPTLPAQRIATEGEAGEQVIVVTGLSGAVRLRLAPPRAGGERDALATAAVESSVRIDGRAAFSEATIRLQNVPPDLARVRVALPARAALRSVAPPAVVVARGGTADRPTIDVSIDRDEEGAATLVVSCERPIDPTGGRTFEAVGFAVDEIEPWRQTGRVSIAVEGEWRAEWADSPGVRRVDPPPGGRGPSVVAAFAYDSQPASLPVAVRPRRGRVVVEPEYRYSVGAVRAGVEARLRVISSGAPATAVVVDLGPDWAIDDVGPPAVIDTGAVTIDRGRVVATFLQPLVGEAFVEVRGSRPLGRETEAVSWALPQPKADLVAPAAVIVTSDSDIELLPDATASEGLVRQTAGGLPRPGSGRAALVYRLDAPPGRFVAARRFLPRLVTAGVTARIGVDEAETVVEQTIRLDVEHVPLEYVELLVPETVAAVAAVDVRRDDVPLYPFEVDAPAGRPDTGVPARCLRAALPEPLLGRGDVTVTYRLPTPHVPAETTVAEDVPLVLPLGVRIERQSVVLVDAGTLAVEMRGDAWRADRAGAERGAGGPRSWTAARRQETVPVALAPRRRARSGDAVVEATWLRTSFLHDRREDVAAFVISGGAERLPLVVPAAAAVAARGSCEVLLDGRPLPVGDREAGGWTVELPRPTGSDRRLLEVRTSLPRGGGTWAERLGIPLRVGLDPPEFPAGTVQRRFYWEITARPDEHLLGLPMRWTAQQQWRPGIVGLRSVPVVSPDVLAAWIRDAAGRPTAALMTVDPPLVERRAVYSGVGPPGRAEPWLVPTWCLVLVASGAALAAGIAAAYLRAARRPAVAVPMLAAAVLAAAAFPGPALVLAQAAVPGAALAVLTWILRRVFEDRDRGSVAAGGAVSASSLTRALPTPPSLIVTGSSLRGAEGSITSGRRGA